MQWVPHLALAALSPCVRRESEAGKVSEVQTLETVWEEVGPTHPCLVFLFTLNSVEILFGFFQGKPLL